ncbi:hypothetical protein BDN72DRAFT_857972 [Pluteus cervinus]|uniref:Uncharacterized protein n=1 Tax=Pluteus cervinus TaxID=181527 RepID=A0ACD3ASX4_9AGAR|nr:hypothetical protein BDN72DRAFT_857972 [Pluteus cervinus]
MITELSLRHTPDLSDASLSFQIPLSSGEELLANSYGDFLNDMDDEAVTPPPISKKLSRHEALTVSQLTPKPVSKATGVAQHHKAPLGTAKAVTHEGVPSKSPVVAVFENTTNSRSSRAEPKTSRRARVPCDEVGRPDLLATDKLINPTSRFEVLKTGIDGLNSGLGQERTATGGAHPRSTDTGTNSGIIGAIPSNPVVPDGESLKQTTQPSKIGKPKSQQSSTSSTELSAQRATLPPPLSTLQTSALGDKLKSQSSGIPSRRPTKVDGPTGTNRVNGSYQLEGTLKLKSAIVNENTNQNPTLNAIVSHDYDVGSTLSRSGNLDYQTPSSEPRDHGPLTLSQISPRKPANQSPPVNKPLDIIVAADRRISGPMSPMRVSRKRPGEYEEEVVVDRLESVASRAQKALRTRKKPRADASSARADPKADKPQREEAKKVEPALPSAGHQGGPANNTSSTSTLRSCESNPKEDLSTTRGDADGPPPLQGPVFEPVLDVSASSSTLTATALVPGSIPSPPLPALPSPPPTTDVPAPALVSTYLPSASDSLASSDPLVPSSESGSGSRPHTESGTRFTRVTRAQTKAILEGSQPPVPSSPTSNVPKPVVEAHEPKLQPEVQQPPHHELKKSGAGTASQTRTGSLGLKKKKSVVIKKDRLASSHPLPTAAATTTSKPVAMTSSLNSLARPTNAFTFRMESKLGPRQVDVDKENRRSQLREKVDQLKESQKKLQRPHDLTDLQQRIPDFKALHAMNEARQRKQGLAPVVTIPLSTEFYTDMRAKKRDEFEERVKMKEAQMEKEREEKRRQREDEEQRAVKELRKRAVPKAHGVPDWYKEAPRKRKAVGEDGR